jgi:ABC-type transporter Mla subunit MlaD
MNPQRKRIFGLVLVIISLVSLIISAGGIVGLWMLKQNAVVAIGDAAALLTDTLVTTDKALTAAEQVLEGTQDSIATLLGTTQAIALALRGGQPTLSSAARLLKQDFPGTIDSVETAITSAAQAARGADDLLKELARIPLLDLNYQPDVPLADSISGIGRTLGELPPKLEEIGSGLEQLNGSLAVMANQIDGLGVTIRQIDTSLRDLPGVLRDYQRQLAQVLPVLESIQKGADQIISLTVLALTFSMLWISAVQIIVLVIGWRWFRPIPRAA